MSPARPTAEEPPLRRDAERNKRRILDAAGELFAPRGLGVTLLEIADRADVGVGTIYRRFPNKDALITELFRGQLEEITALAEEALRIPDPWDGLVQFLSASLERQARSRGLTELLFGSGINDDLAAWSRDRITPLGTRLVERARDAGELRPDIVATDLPIFQMMIGAVASYTQQADPEVWRRAFTVLLDGLRAPPDRRLPMPTEPLDQDGVIRAVRAWQPVRQRAAETSGAE